MNREALKTFTHNSASFLDIGHQAYKQWVFRYTFLELEKDLGPGGDLTTRAVFPEDFPVEAKIIAREDGIIAGLAEIKYFLLDADANFRPAIKGALEMESKVKDGDKIVAGAELVKLKGGVRDLLAVERVILNLLMRMSGVATMTRRMVELAGDKVLICPTRKTLWGLLDKKAVVLGGGGTHRLNLSDAIIVKDTHLDILRGDLAAVFDRLDTAQADCRFVEIEVSDEAVALQAAQLFGKSGMKAVGVLMFDNMKPVEIMHAVEAMKKRGLFDKILLEASGGIDERNLKDYAGSGVDIVSLGCLTNGARSLDMSMKVAR